MPHIPQRQVLVSCQCKYSSRSSNNNMRAFILQQLFVELDVDTTIENSNLYIRQISAEPLKLMTDLQICSQLAD